MVRIISEKEREQNRQEWLKQLAQQTQENQSRKERERLDKKMASPPPMFNDQGGELAKGGRRTLKTINQFEKAYNITSHPAASIASGRSSRVDAYANQSPQPVTDFFWEARLAGANRDRNRLPHQSPIPSHGSHGVSTKTGNQQQTQANDLNSIRYSRVKTDIREYDPDAEVKMEANRQWKESIEKQIEEKRQRDLLIKQKEEYEEHIRITKALKEQQEYPASNIPSLKGFRKEPPMAQLGPIPDIMYTQKAYSISDEQMKHNSKIPRFQRELFHPSVKEKKAEEKAQIEVIVVPEGESIKAPLKKKALPVIRPPQKRHVDQKHDEALAGVIPGSHPHPPRNYIPKRNKPSFNDRHPHSNLEIPLNPIQKDLPPIASAPEPSKEAINTSHVIPKITTTNLPSPQSQNEATSAKSPASYLDPRSPNKVHQRFVRGHQSNEMEKLREENLQHLNHLKKVLEEKRIKFAK